MARKIEIGSHVIDHAHEIRKATKEDLGLDADITVIRCYTLEGRPTSRELQFLSEALADNVAEVYSYQRPLANDFQWDVIAEVWLKPGILDPEGRTISKEVAADVIGKTYPVHASTQYLFKGVTKQEAERIVEEVIASSLTNIWEVYTRDEIDPEKMLAYVPKYRSRRKPRIATYDIARITDDSLLELSNGRRLALDLPDMKTLQKYISDPEVLEERARIGLTGYTDVELEFVGILQSDHCRHRTFNGRIEYEEDGRREIIDSLFKTGIVGATERILQENPSKAQKVKSVLKDNSGVVDLDAETLATIKVETHNFPCSVGPYGGATTDSDGVARDTVGTGKGAREIARTDIFCFGPLDYSGDIGTNHPRRTKREVVRGFEHAGNRMGVPTVNGTIRDDSYPFGSVKQGEAVVSYHPRCLVYGGSAGIMPASINGQPSYQKKANAGDIAIMVGGRIGRDGIHGGTGASMASGAAVSTSEVQVDDQIVQKRMFDALLEARDMGLYKSITDSGAGGIASGLGEMAAESGGIRLYLDRASQMTKEEGMNPWEMLVSESQNRMFISVHPDNYHRLADLLRRRGVEYIALGEFTASGRIHITYDDKPIVYLGLDFVHSEFPQKTFYAKWQQVQHKEPDFEQPELDWALQSLLARPNIASNEDTVRRYDHEVQGQTVGKPLTGKYNDGPADAAVLWPLEMQEKDSPRGIVLSNGINANYGFIDTYHMVASNIDEAIRNAVAVGANPDEMYLLDNFCWSDPEDPYRMAQLVRAVRACYDSAVGYGTPFVSGKDSMHNEFSENGKKVSMAPPTFLATALGIIEDINKIQTMDVKKPGSYVYALGLTDEIELGGSEYYAMLSDKEAWIGNNVPRVDVPVALRTYRALHQAIVEGVPYAVHDLSEGGLAVASAEMAFAGGYGIDLQISGLPRKRKGDRHDYLLFSESNSRLLVEVPEKAKAEFEYIMRTNDVPYGIAGCTTSGDWLNVYDGKQRIVHSRLQDLKNSWQGIKNAA